MYTKVIEPTKIDQARLDALKLSLPHGALIQIARDLNITRHTVEQVFKGRFDNEAVIDKAIEILEEAKSRKQMREARIDQVLNN